MIRAELSGTFEQFVARLARKASSLAAAQTQSRALDRRGDPARWRRAKLLWPLFAKG